jgi:flagellar biosynthesis protein FlhF
MRLKTFVGKNLKDALAQARAELGADAIIVSQQKSKSGVMVRAAAEDAAMPEPEQAEPKASPVLASFEERYRESLLARLRNGPPSSDGKPRYAFDRGQLLSILRANRVPEMLVPVITEEAERRALPDLVFSLASALDRRMRTCPVDVSEPTAFLLAGPNGAGKTTVAAKLAAHACLAGRAVRLVATDLAGAGALARLEGFGAHLDLPVTAAPNAAALATAVAHAEGDNVLLIADTAGFDPRSAAAWQEFLALTSVPGMEVLGIVSATMDAEEAWEVAEALSRLGATRLIVTGLDLVRRRGALTALAMSGLAIAQVTRSPFLADGLEPITPLALARLLIESGAAGPKRDGVA